MTGDSFHLLAIDVPLAFVLASPCLLFASTRKRRNAPLVVPAVVLFALGMSSLYVALIEGPSTAPVFKNLRPDLELLQHQHDLTTSRSARSWQPQSCSCWACCTAVRS
jgi:hypothetical protein